MISIQPKWVEKILNREKDREFRKTMPKCEFPIDAYIYCTKDRKDYLTMIDNDKHTIVLDRDGEIGSWGDNVLNGKVVAKFTLKDIDEFYVFNDGIIQYWIACDLEKGCVPYDDLANYIGRGKKGYSWHIDNLEIFDNPKELSEFKKFNPLINDYGFGAFARGEKMYVPLIKAPQSWCYCEVEQ